MFSGSGGLLLMMIIAEVGRPVVARKISGSLKKTAGFG